MRRLGAATAAVVWFLVMAMWGADPTSAAIALPPTVCGTVVDGRGQLVTSMWDSERSEGVGGATVSAVFARAYSVYRPSPTDLNPNRKQWMRFPAGSVITADVTDESGRFCLSPSFAAAGVPQRDWSIAGSVPTPIVESDWTFPNVRIVATWDEPQGQAATTWWPNAGSFQAASGISGQRISDGPPDLRIGPRPLEPGRILTPVDANADGIVRVANLGDSFSSGEGLRTNASTQFDCGTDLPRARYYEDTNVEAALPDALPIHPVWDYSIGRVSCQISSKSQAEPGDAWWTRTVSEHENRCHRTGLAYGPRLWNQLGARGDDATFLACSGAKTKDVTNDPSHDNTHYGNGQYPASPWGVAGGNKQYRDLAWFNEAAATDVITIGIGGNDLGTSKGLSEVILDCITPFEVPKCSRADVELRVTTTVKPNLIRVFGALRAQNPQAAVFAFGYPRIFDAMPIEAGGWCLDAATEAAFAYADMEWVDKTLIPRLNRAIASAADQSGVTYVNVQNSSAGHGVCTLSPWFNSPSPSDAGSLHPTQEWHSEVARRFAARHIYGDQVAVRQP